MPVSVDTWINAGWPARSNRCRSMALWHRLVLPPANQRVKGGRLSSQISCGGRFQSMRSYLDLAFMGAAFLLLETKNVVQFALLFGATWFVNALVFAGVLVAVYLAVETARWVRLPRPAVLYAALIAALALAWLVPQESLLSLPMAARFLAASALAFAPVYLANLDDFAMPADLERCIYFRKLACGDIQLGRKWRESNIRDREGVMTRRQIGNRELALGVRYSFVAIGF